MHGGTPASLKVAKCIAAFRCREVSCQARFTRRGSPSGMGTILRRVFNRFGRWYRKPSFQAAMQAERIVAARARWPTKKK